MNKLFSIVLIMMLSLPVSVWAVVDIAENNNAQAEVVNTLDDDIENIDVNNDSEFDYKEPVGTKKIVKKFLAAMCGVAASSILICFGLTLYNRVRENFVRQGSIQANDTSLETPDNIEDAVRTFLDKTNWS